MSGSQVNKGHGDIEDKDSKPNIRPSEVGHHKASRSARQGSPTPSINRTKRASGVFPGASISTAQQEKLMSAEINENKQGEDKANKPTPLPKFGNLLNIQDQILTIGLSIYLFPRQRATFKYEKSHPKS